MIALLLAIAVEQSATTPPTAIATVQTTSSFAVPDELAPAVIPYVKCLTDGMNAAFNDSPDGVSAAELPKVGERVKQACATVRAQAKSQGVSLLDSSNDDSSSEHEAQVEGLLVTAEKFVLEPPRPPPIGIRQ